MKFYIMQIEKKFFPELRLRIYTGARYPLTDLSRKWYVEYYLEDERKRVYGKINQESTVEKRLELAKELAIRTLAKVQHDFSIKDRLREHVQQRKYRREKTKQDYESKIRVLLDFLKGKKLNKEEVEKFFHFLLTKRHEATYNKYLTILRQIFEELNIGRLLSDLKLVKAVSTPAQYFQRHQADLLMTRIENHERLLLCVQLMFYCYLRPGEIRKMKVSDIFFEERKIIVRKDISKNGKTQYVAIPDKFYPIIKKMIYRQPNEYIIGNPTKEGRMVSKNYFSTIHLNILRSFGFDTDRFKLYSWRHTSAVMAAKAGISLKSLQIQMRHHSLDQTDQYLRQMGVLDQDDLREKMPAMVFQAA